MSSHRDQLNPGLSQEHWHQLCDASDEICDVLDGLEPTLALAALGNVACSVWETYGDEFPDSVMLDWLRCIHRMTSQMHKPRPTH